MTEINNTMKPLYKNADFSKKKKAYQPETKAMDSIKYEAADRLRDKIQEGYRDYHNNRTGFARPKREDDEYVNGPDRVTHKHQFTVTHPEHNEGKPHRREVTTANSTKTKAQAADAARQHLLAKGFKIQEEVDLEEGTFKYHMDKAIAADQKGDDKKKAYHLDNARSAKLAMPSKDYAKNRELLDKHKQMSEGYNDIGPQYGGAGSGRSADAMETAKLTRHAKAAAKKAGVTFNTSAEYRGWHAKQKPKKTVKEEVVLESHEKAAKEIHGALFHNAIPPGSESHFVNSVLKNGIIFVFDCQLQHAEIWF
jgi:hypothetical protein